MLLRLGDGTTPGLVGTGGVLEGSFILRPGRLELEMDAGLLEGGVVLP